MRTIVEDCPERDCERDFFPPQQVSRGGKRYMATYFARSLFDQAPEAPKRLRKGETAMTFSLRKEVIQPQVLLRLPCYDFTPIMNHTLGGCLPCGLAHRLLVRPTFVM